MLNQGLLQRTQDYEFDFYRGMQESSLRVGFAADFEPSLGAVLGHEGGNDDDPQDPGGRTSRGIIQTEWERWRRAHPERGLPSDVWKAPQGEVEQIYREWYWDVLRCDELPQGVDYAVFDYGINSGVGRSAKVLQRLVGVAVDGTIGSATLAAAHAADARKLVNQICDERQAFLEGLRTFPRFGRGWTRRVKEVRELALKMVGTPKPLPTPVPASDLEQKLVWAMEAAGHQVDRNPGELNIIYVEGMNLDGSLNDNTPNQFNDARFVLGFVDGRHKLLGKWEATTEPSRRWTVSPMNPGGAARIAFGKYRAWQVGYHRNDSNHEALVQTGGKVTVYRDKNKDYKRDGDKTDTGFFGINQHHGYDLPKGDLGSSSAGCLVGRSVAGHREFMKLVKTDVRYKANKQYVFSSTVLEGRAVTVARPPSTRPGVPKPEPAPAPLPAPEPAPKPAPKMGVFAGIAAALAATGAWLADHPVAVVAAAVVITAIVVFYLNTRKDK